MTLVQSVNELGGEIVESEHPSGVLRFENFKAGEWLTQKGEPAKKSRRRYLLDDVEMVPVSSLVDNLDKPALLHWIEDHSVRGGAEAQRLGELDDVPPEEMMDRVKLLGLGSSAKRDEGADRGNAIHAVFEAKARYDVTPNPDAFPAAWRPWLDGALAAWDELNPTPLAIEEMVCHPEHRYAGRPDLICLVDGVRTLIDYKTGKGKVYDQAHYQTRLYSLALEPSGIEPVERIVIVGIDDNGNFTPYDCEATEDDALYLLWLHHGRKRINAGMAAQRKARKAARA